MAGKIYNVDQTGNAPKGASVGDYVKTAGGTYKIVDGSRYKNMSPSDLSKAGVSYNQNSGLYSTKVSDSEMYAVDNGVNLMRTSVLDGWLNSANQSALSKIAQDYDKNVANVNRAYNSNVSDLKEQAREAQANYVKSINQNYEDTYYANKVAQQIASNAGLTSSAQGQAMSTSGLVQAAMNASEMANDKNMAINNVRGKLNELSANKSITLSELEKAKLEQELESFNTNQLEYLARLLDVEGYNAGVINEYNMNRIQQNFAAEEAEKERQFAAREAAKQRAFASAGNGSGGGNTNAEEGLDPLVQRYALDLDLKRNNGEITEEQYQRLDLILAGIAGGYATPERYIQEYNKIFGANKKSPKQLKNSNGKKIFLNKASFSNYHYQPYLPPITAEE